MGEILQHLPATVNADVLVGLETRDDAGVYRLKEDLAMIQTVDFFTPIVDDPYDFGQIAAANSLSDIYAMGGTPRTALNILGFPVEVVSKEAIARIIQGGYDKAREAGVEILGGHSVKDPELKYGLAVTGFVHPGEIIRNNTPQIGDLLVLTKPIGTGILTTALKKEKLPDDLLHMVTGVMKQLNKTAAEVMKQHGAHACTDITGFGLLGHMYEMVAERQDVGFRVEALKIPLLPSALEFARAGNIPGGLKENQKFLTPKVNISTELDEALVQLLFDPQTSGGLLIACSPESVDGVLRNLTTVGVEASVIGECVPREEKAIEVI
ncbi:MAG: selenide, water dikinase SelD [Calditrichaeota bacterium]|nr:MAG: selenide, water dikinase SelD [Calditrichota bacterium]